MKKILLAMFLVFLAMPSAIAETYYYYTPKDVIDYGEWQETSPLLINNLGEDVGVMQGWVAVVNATKSPAAAYIIKILTDPAGQTIIQTHLTAQDLYLGTTLEQAQSTIAQNPSLAAKIKVKDWKYGQIKNN